MHTRGCISASFFDHPRGHSSERLYFPRWTDWVHSPALPQLELRSLRNYTFQVKLFCEMRPMLARLIIMKLGSMSGVLYIKSILLVLHVKDETG